VKGVAVRYVILMVLGLLVLAVLSFLILKTSSTPTLSVTECRAKFVDICRRCMLTGWDESVEVTEYEDIVKPCSEYSELFEWWDNRCCGNGDECGWMKDDCKGMLGG